MRYNHDTKYVMLFWLLVLGALTITFKVIWWILKLVFTGIGKLLRGNSDGFFIENGTEYMKRDGVLYKKLGDRYFKCKDQEEA